MHHGRTGLKLNPLPRGNLDFRYKQLEGYWMTRTHACGVSTTWQSVQVDPGDRRARYHMDRVGYNCVPSGTREPEQHPVIVK